ncbi:MAG: type I polyketide synthase, partial [Byssovorax sp.]
MPPAARGAHFWEGSWSPEDTPYLMDHRVRGVIVLPAAATVEIALAAAQAAHGAGPHALEEWTFREALVFSAGEARRIQVVVSERSPAATEPRASASFQLFSRQDGETPAAEAWTLHARGTIRLHVGCAERVAGEAPEVIQKRATIEIAGEAYYQALTARGFDYGPSFQGVRRVWRGQDEAMSRISLPEGQSAAPYTLHPALLDACFQTLLSLLPTGSAPFVPVRLRHFRVHRRPAGEVFGHALRRSPEGEAARLEGDVTLLDAAGQILVEARGLELLRLADAPRPIRREDGDDPLLTLEWQRSEAPRPPARAATNKQGRWWLLADKGGLAAEVASLLARRGEPSTPATFTSPEALETLLRGAFGDGEPCRGVVHLSSLDAEEAEDAMTPEALDVATLEGCHCAISLAQAITRAGLRGAPKLWLVTRRAQAVGADRAARVAVTQAPLWGLGQTLLYEHPELCCARVDLSGAPGEAEALVEELCSESREDQVALRPEGRYVARLVAGAVSPGVDIPVRPDGTYLITGGLGGLGLSLGRWLVERGARHLVLVGRRGAKEPSQIDAVAALEAASAQVMVAQADVSNRAELARVLGDARTRMPPLRGVIHAAGVLDDGLVMQQSRERFREVMAPKVHGAWNLHALTREAPLDFFVLYSSAASLLGSPGQSNYAAANAFLDALAHLRAARGLPALSINWGPFAGVGLAAAEERRGARLAERGMGSLSVARGHAILGRLLGSEATQVGAALLDVHRWIDSYPAIASSPLFSSLSSAPARAEEARFEVPRLRASVMATAPEERLRRLTRILREQVVKVLRVEPSRVHRTTNLMSLGVDSLLGLELRNRLELELNLKLPSTLFWTYPHIDALANHLLELLGSSETSADVEPAPAPVGAQSPPTVEIQSPPTVEIQS